MGTTTLPPQAYTRDILAKAFVWSQSQPESIRKLANSPDALVGLFLRAQRNGDASFETVAPVSRDNFMTDLKTLASELEQFDVPQEQPVKVQQMQYHGPNPQVVNAQPNSQSPNYSAQNMAVQNYSTQNIVVQNFQLDTKSKELIQEVKDQLNLSSEAEVLRFLIVLGHERAKLIFPSK